MVSIVGVLVGLYLALLWAPTEAVMGDVQRIFYFHMPSAWVALGPSFTVVFVCSIVYLVKKDLRYDRIAAASAEIGVMFTTITLVTGPLWARPIWGAYWTWDPRLTTTLVLWFIFVAYLMLRASSSPGHKRARLCAVVGIVGLGRRADRVHVDQVVAHHPPVADQRTGHEPRLVDGVRAHVLLGRVQSAVCVLVDRQGAAGGVGVAGRPAPSAAPHAIGGRE